MEEEATIIAEVERLVAISEETENPIRRIVSADFTNYFG